MAYRDLRDFLAKLEKEGELARISAEVDPVLEITEITDRVTKSGGPALLFERPKGSRVPLVINLLGSGRRMNLALEVQTVEEAALGGQSFVHFKSRRESSTSSRCCPSLPNSVHSSRNQSGPAPASK